MNHGLKLHPDGTLEITMPSGKKVTRVLVCEAGTQNGTLMYPDSDQKEIVYCKDCRKHNVRVGFDINFHNVRKEDACPLVSWRNKANGHEYDYQFCCYGDKKE